MSDIHICNCMYEHAFVPPGRWVPWCVEHESHGPFRPPPPKWCEKVGAVVSGTRQPEAHALAKCVWHPQGAFIPTEVKCDRCQDIQWVCEEHTTKPWAGIIGDDKGCAPDCPGPGMPCPDCIKEGRWGNADEVVWDTTVESPRVAGDLPLHGLRHHDREALATIPAGTPVRVTVTVIDEDRWWASKPTDRSC